MIKDFIALIFPELCLGCNSPLLKKENCICTLCRYKLPKTDFHLDPENTLSSRFWGKITIKYCLSYLRFNKGSKVQKIIYKIKYEGRKEGAHELGKWYARELVQYSYHQKFDLILPVPLHRKKLRKRGFNQSDWFAMGLSEGLNVEWSDTVLIKAENRSTQTKKSRWKRWVNVQELYLVKKPDCVTGKRVLLVDDVVTTGSTLEACAAELLKAGAAEVSIATIACAV